MATDRHGTRRDTGTNGGKTSVKRPFQYSIAVCRRCRGEVIHRDDLIDHSDAPPEILGMVIFNGCKCEYSESINMWFRDVPKNAVVIWGEKEI